MQIMDNLGKHAKGPNNDMQAPSVQLSTGLPWSVYIPPHTRLCQHAILGQRAGRVGVQGKDCWLAEMTQKSSGR